MEDGRTAATVAAGDAPPPTAAGEQPHFYLRLEYISERSTRVVLAAQSVGMLGCLAMLILLVLAQVRIPGRAGEPTHPRTTRAHPTLRCSGLPPILGLPQYSKDGSSLTRDNRLEALNLAVASCCLLLLGGSGAFFARRVWVARRAGWGPRRAFLLASTGVDLTLQLINASVFLTANAVSVQVRVLWRSAAGDGFFFFCALSVAPLVHPAPPPPLPADQVPLAVAYRGRLVPGVQLAVECAPPAQRLPPTPLAARRRLAAPALALGGARRAAPLLCTLLLLRW